MIQKENNKWAILLSCALFCLISCTKTTLIPDPQTESEPIPVESRFKVYTNSFKMYDMLYKTDAYTGNTFVETGRQEVISGQKSYTGYYQCFAADGTQKWNEWIPITKLPSEQFCNKTVFDITSEGAVIDCFNVKDLETGAQIPYIQKMTPEGEFPWGRDGKPFYTFVQDLEYDVDPCEGFVAADHYGGAWVAAGNAMDSIVVARVDKDGNIGTIIGFDSEGTLGRRTYVSHPQMMVRDNDELYLLLQYSDMVGSLDIGYYDIVRISSQGKILSRETLMPERFFSRGIYAHICPDRRGGAYVIFKASDDFVLHLFMEHFNSFGKIDFPEIDLNPKGPAGSTLSVCAAVEPQSGKCVTVFMDDSSMRTYLYAQVVDINGNLLLGEAGDPKLLFKTDDGTFLRNTSGFKLFHYQGDNRMHLYYVLEQSHRDPVLKTCTISVDGRISDERDVVEMDTPMLSDGYEDSVDAVSGRTARFWWISTNTKNIYSFSDEL